MFFFQVYYLHIFFLVFSLNFFLLYLLLDQSLIILSRLFFLLKVHWLYFSLFFRYKRRLVLLHRFYLTLIFRLLLDYFLTAHELGFYGASCCNHLSFVLENLPLLFNSRFLQGSEPLQPG